MTANGRRQDRATGLIGRRTECDVLGRLVEAVSDCGHFVAEEAPEEMLAALTAFLAP